VLRGTKLSKIGEDVIETLDVIPRQWFVTEQRRTSRRDCRQPANRSQHNWPHRRQDKIPQSSACR
jgi:hypothetical protein